MLPDSSKQKKDKTGKSAILSGLGVLGVLALKFKGFLLVGLKALSFLKISWLFGPILTIGFYAMFFGVPYALAIFLILVIHEMGHWIWMKALGLEPKMPVFLPFIAYVAMTKLPPEEATRAWVAFAGPLVGGLGSAILFWFGVQNNNAWMMAAGNTGFFLNLFQLIPTRPFDGGFIVQAISKWLLIPGLVILVALTFMFQSSLLFFISIISFFSLIGQFTAPSAQQSLSASGKRLSHVVDKQNQSPFPSGAQQPSILQTSSNIPAPAGGFAFASGIMQPATIEQRILISLAYIILAAGLAWLYRLSSDQLTVFLPHHK